MMHPPILTGNEMGPVQIGGVKLFRPRLQGEQLARNEAEKHLREGYPCGTYTGRDQINEIVRSQFNYFYALLREQIAKSASLHLMDFVLGQYDLAAAIEQKRKNGELTGDDAAYWVRRGPIIRRGLKHLAELITMLAPPEAPQLSTSALPLNLDTIVICGEMLVELYSLSDQTYGIHPDDTVLTIAAEGTLDYLELRVQEFEKYSGFPARIGHDTARQKQYLFGRPLRYDLNFQADSLDEAFCAEFGFTYLEAIQALMLLIDNDVAPDPAGFQMPFIRRDQMIDCLVKAKGWSASAVDRLLAGFTVTKEAMEQEGRVIYKPKQEYRALRRGFFELPHSTGRHLAWSRCMARECIFELMKGTLFQRCPTEWRSDRIGAALASLQRKAGGWFEKQVDRNMATLGFLGKASLTNGIGSGSHRIAIPSNVGEIDYLGFLPSMGLLVVLEDKMVDGAAESSHFRDDISDFVNGRKPYSEQLRRKVAWVRENHAGVCRGLSSVLPGPPSITPRQLAGAIVTLHPTYASYFIPDYPCVSLVELVDEFTQQGCWPYSLGVVDLA